MQSCLHLVWMDSSGGASCIVIICLVHFYRFYFSIAPPIYPPCPACVDHWWALSPSCFPAPLSSLWWCHCCIAFTLPVLVWSHCPLILALTLLVLLSYAHCCHHQRPISSPSPLMYVYCLRRIPSCSSCQRWHQNGKSNPSALTMPMPMPLLYVPCLVLCSTAKLASPSHVRSLNQTFLCWYFFLAVIDNESMFSFHVDCSVLIFFLKTSGGSW